MFFNFILDMKKISSFVELNEIVLIIIIINNRWRFMDMIYQDIKARGIYNNEKFKKILKCYKINSPSKRKLLQNV